MHPFDVGGGHSYEERERDCGREGEWRGGGGGDARVTKRDRFMQARPAVSVEPLRRVPNVSGLGIRDSGLASRRNPAPRAVCLVRSRAVCLVRSILFGIPEPRKY